MIGRGHGRGCRRGLRGLRFLEPVLLLLLHHGPAHGYTLLEQLTAFDLGQMHPTVIYRLLRAMEEQGWVASTWDEEQSQGPPRRVYRLTALGDEVLAQWAQNLEETRQAIDRFLNAYREHMQEGEGEHH